MSNMLVENIGCDVLMALQTLTHVSIATVSSVRVQLVSDRTNPSSHPQWQLLLVPAASLSEQQSKVSVGVTKTMAGERKSDNKAVNLKTLQMCIYLQQGLNQDSADWNSHPPIQQPTSNPFSALMLCLQPSSFPEVSPPGREETRLTPARRAQTLSAHYLHYGAEICS